MKAAAHIGRIGGLAVALGVGTSIATGHGVAYAEDTDSASPPPPNTDASATTASGTTSNTTTPNTTAATATTTTTTGTTTPSTEQSTTTQTPESQETTTSPTNTSTEVAPGVVVSAQTNTSTTTETPDEPEEIEPTTPPPPDLEKPKETKPADPPEADTAPAGSSKSTTTTTGGGTSLASAPSSPPVSARTVESLPDPATTIQQPDTVAVFADARSLASAGPTAMSPMMAAQAGGAAEEPEPPAPAAAAQNPLEVATTVVSTVIGWVLNPLAGTTPAAPAQPPVAWALLAFARREFENFFSALRNRTVESGTMQTTSLALAAAAVDPFNPPPASPVPGAQLSPSTQFVRWVTGNYDYVGQPLLANSLYRFGISGTDVGVMWDNGMVDDPATPYNEHQVLIAFGDTFGLRSVPGEHWRWNALFRSSDMNLADGMDIPPGEFGNGNMFGGAPLWDNPLPGTYQHFARQIIHPDGLPAGITLIPTAGISVPTPGTQFGVTQYVNFMSVTQWGAPGYWTTNYSAIAYSTDNGENWRVAPGTVRYNQPWSGNQNFQQAAYVRPGDGYVYTFGTPNGRQGAAYVARVPEAKILDLSSYEYYNKGTTGWFGSTPAGWYKNNPAAATPVFGQDAGACGAGSAGNTVSEMSIQYNAKIQKFVALYTDQNNSVVMRTASQPQGTWSTAKVLIPQQPGGIYAPMMHPWSPSTLGTGNDLYWNLSLWSEYNVMLMRTDITKV